MAEFKTATRKDALEHIRTIEFFKQVPIDDPIAYFTEQIATLSEKLDRERQFKPNDPEFSAIRKDLTAEEYFAWLEEFIEWQRAYLIALVDPATPQ